MGNYREILPKMVNVSNNSHLTYEVSSIIADKLSFSEFMKFQRWLKLVEESQQQNDSRKKRMF